MLLCASLHGGLQFSIALKFLKDLANLVQVVGRRHVGSKDFDILLRLVKIVDTLVGVIPVMVLIILVLECLMITWLLSWFFIL